MTKLSYHEKYQNNTCLPGEKTTGIGHGKFFWKILLFFKYLSNSDTEKSS